jgi:hypothetical protein
MKQRLIKRNGQWWIEARYAFDQEPTMRIMRWQVYEWHYGTPTEGDWLEYWGEGRYSAESRGPCGNRVEVRTRTSFGGAAPCEATETRPIDPPKGGPRTRSVEWRDGRWIVRTKTTRKDIDPDLWSIP